MCYLKYHLHDKPATVTLNGQTLPTIQAIGAVMAQVYPFVAPEILDATTIRLVNGVRIKSCD